MTTDGAPFAISVEGLTKRFGERTVVNGIDNSNTIADPMLGGISRTADAGLDPIPMAGSPTRSIPAVAHPGSKCAPPVATLMSRCAA